MKSRQDDSYYPKINPDSDEETKQPAAIFSRGIQFREVSVIPASLIALSLLSPAFSVSRSAFLESEVYRASVACAELDSTVNRCNFRGRRWKE